MKVIKVTLYVCLVACVLYSISLSKQKQTLRVIDKTKLVKQEVSKDDPEVQVLAKRIEALENKPMTDFAPQSTDQVSKTTNPKTSQIVAQGDFSITLSTAESTGVSGQAVVAVNNLDGSLTTPLVDVAITEIQGGTGIWQFRPAPYTTINTSGLVATNCNFIIDYSVAETVPAWQNKIRITVNYYSRTASLNTVVFGTYLVRSETYNLQQ